MWQCPLLRLSVLTWLVTYTTKLEYNIDAAIPQESQAISPLFEDETMVAQMDRNPEVLESGSNYE